MITSVLKGGLGNQMFQYAIGRSVAHVNNDALSLDKSSYGHSRAYPYPCHIDMFDIKDTGRPVSGYPVNEHSLQYNSDIVKKYEWDNITLNGYWQDYRYFEFINESLRFDLKLKPEYMSDQYFEVEDLMKNFAEPVFVHIRREERANDKRAKSVHGLMGTEYYYKAIHYIKRKRPDTTFLFFTDDYGYALNEYSNNGYIIPSLIDYEHFSLMCQCDHGIVANSSFSWWAAWLIQNLDKIVVAPNMWTVDPERSNKKIVPGEWKKLNPQFEI